MELESCPFVTSACADRCICNAFHAEARSNGGREGYLGDGWSNYDMSRMAWELMTRWSPSFKVTPPKLISRPIGRFIRRR